MSLKNFGPMAATKKWSKERVVLKKIQLHFTFKTKVLAKIRHEAADENINPSDVVRKIIGLPYKVIQRARVGLNFSDDELQNLTHHYGLDEVDKNEIVRRVVEEIDAHYKKGERT